MVNSNVTALSVASSSVTFLYIPRGVSASVVPMLLDILPFCGSCNATLREGEPQDIAFLIKKAGNLGTLGELTAFVHIDCIVRSDSTCDCIHLHWWCSEPVSLLSSRIYFRVFS